MIFYLSGYDAINEGAVKDWAIQKCIARLQSCHSVHIKSTDAWLSRSLELGVCGQTDLMLDSGAFTAWNAGHHMKVEDLLPLYGRLQESYEKAYKSIVYINLDTIPGSRKTPPTEKQVEEALVESDKNFYILEKELGKGKILPVFHQGEPWDRLGVVAGQSKFICISARQGLSEYLRVNFIQQCVGYLHDNNLDNDLHGLATTGNTIIRCAKWFSVDSASWALAAAFGSIIIEVNGNIRAVPVSDQSPTRFDRDRHATTFSPAFKEVIEEKLAKYNLTIEMVSNNHNLRRAFNMATTQDWAELLRKEKREHRMEQGLFEYF